MASCSHVLALLKKNSTSRGGIITNTLVQHFKTPNLLHVLHETLVLSPYTLMLPVMLLPYSTHDWLRRATLPS